MSRRVCGLESDRPLAKHGARERMAAMDDGAERDGGPPVDAVPALLVDNFAIFRRNQVPGDAVPEDRRSILQRGRVARRGLNPELARRVLTRLGDVWVIPGRDWVALFDGSMTAGPIEPAVHNGKVMWGSFHTGVELVTGLVPDGVAKVTLLSSSGEQRLAAVRSNIYRAELSTTFRLGRFLGPAGEVTFGPGSRANPGQKPG